MEEKFNYLTDIKTYEINRLPAHSDHIAYASLDEVEAGKSSLVKCLNGTWKFKYSTSPQLRPVDFYELNFNDSSFDTIEVPSHVELSGYGHPHYSNVPYPWDGYSNLKVGEVDMENNSVASYITYFDLPDSFDNKRVHISFQGVETAFYLYVNGRFVGYSEDSFTGAEFDITNFVTKANNKLAVEVYRRSTASWLQDQDFFRFMGIFRDVNLLAIPEVHLEDMWLKCELDKDLSTGLLTPYFKVMGDASIEIAIENKKFNYNSKKQETYCIKNVAKWNVGEPNLYNILITVRNKNGEIEEYIPYKIGFKRVEIKDGELLLNGERLIISGVNRHEWSARSGRCITKEDMILANKIMLDNNFNLSRCSHYPNNSYWYELADKTGLLIMDEANIETHGTWQVLGQTIEERAIPGNNEEWRGPVLDRVKSMFERDKNHVSIAIWSLGNESYSGEIFASASRALHASDDTRPISYEGVYQGRATYGNEFDDISDFESVMYTTPEEADAWMSEHKDKPYLEIEYMHCMGNSVGGMESYKKLADKHKNYAGGIVWDFMDQALLSTDDLGRQVLKYGGDFDDRQSDFNFSCDGIVDSLGTPKPCMSEIAYWNKCTSERIKLDNNNAKMRICSKDALSAHDKVCSNIRVVMGDTTIGVTTPEASMLFSVKDAGIISFKKGEQEFIYRSPKISYTRATTENDIASNFEVKSGIWNAVETSQFMCGFELNIPGIKLKADITDIAQGKPLQDLITPTSDNDDKICEVIYTFANPILQGMVSEIIYSIDRDGSLVINAMADISKDLPELACFGLRFETAHRIDQTTWTGYSDETYPDRFKGSIFGEHTEKPHIPNYIVPQECGNHYHTYAFSLKSQESTLSVEMINKPFSFSAIPNSVAQLRSAAHKEELPDVSRTYVGIFSEMRGVGGINTWGADVEEAYHVPSEGHHELKIRLS